MQLARCLRQVESEYQCRRSTEARSISTEVTPSLKVIHRVDAAYPEEARQERIQGEVGVEIAVNDKGAVIDARALSGHEKLRAGAVEAAKQFRFENGYKKTVAATLTFNFVLGEKK